MSETVNDTAAFACSVARRVPAYRAFLAAHDFRASTSSTLEQLPLMSKQNYLLQYPIEQVCWDGQLGNCHIIGASSGFSQSGSVFWPKRPEDEGQYLQAIEAMLTAHYGIDQRRTLILCCMAFGTWFGGMAITSALRVLASTGSLPITVATPGLNLAEAVEIYARFGAQFEQTLWITNPANIGLISSLLHQRGITPPAGSCSFAVIGEYFSEAAREATARRYGHAPHAPFVVWTGYGSADTGDLAVETAATIALRKFFHHRSALAQQWFGSTEVPMLLAPSPKAHLEIVDGLIVVTKDQLVPLVRYNTGDAGGLLQKSTLLGLAELPEEILAALPDAILYVHGRASDAVIFYGTNLDIREMDRFFLDLPQDMAYAGLFTLESRSADDVTHFEFTVMVDAEASEALAQRYHQALLGFLSGRSLEFAAKYTALSRSAGQDLITLTVQRADARTGAIKHRHIVQSA